MLSKDNPQQESYENAREAERLYNVAQKEKAVCERKQEEDGEEFWEELDERGSETTARSLARSLSVRA